MSRPHNGHSRDLLLPPGLGNSQVSVMPPAPQLVVNGGPLVNDIQAVALLAALMSTDSVSAVDRVELAQDILVESYRRRGALEAKIKAAVAEEKT